MESLRLRIPAYKNKGQKQFKAEVLNWNSKFPKAERE